MKLISLVRVTLYETLLSLMDFRKFVKKDTTRYIITAPTPFRLEWFSFPSRLLSEDLPPLVSSVVGVPDTGITPDLPVRSLSTIS